MSEDSPAAPRFAMETRRPRQERMFSGHRRTHIHMASAGRLLSLADPVGLCGGRQRQESEVTAETAAVTSPSRRSAAARGTAAARPRPAPAPPASGASASARRPNKPTGSWRGSGGNSDGLRGVVTASRLGRLVSQAGDRPGAAGETSILLWAALSFVHWATAVLRNSRGRCRRRRLMQQLFASTTAEQAGARLAPRPRTTEGSLCQHECVPETPAGDPGPTR
jgi:hypothetical protein